MSRSDVSDLVGVVGAPLAQILPHCGQFSGWIVDEHPEGARQYKQGASFYETLVERLTDRHTEHGLKDDKVSGGEPLPLREDSFCQGVEIFW